MTRNETAIALDRSSRRSSGLRTPSVLASWDMVVRQSEHRDTILPARTGRTEQVQALGTTVAQDTRCRASSVTMVCVRRQLGAAVGVLAGALSWATGLQRLGTATGDAPAPWLGLALLVVVLPPCFVYALAPRKLRFWERWEYPFDTPIAEAIRRVIAATPDHSWATEASADTHVFVKVLHRKMCNGDLSVAGSCREFERPDPISKARCQALTPAVGLVPGGRVSHLLHSEISEDHRASEVYRNLHVRSADLDRLWPHAKQPPRPVPHQGIS